MMRLFVLFVLSFFISGYILSQNSWINEFHYDNAGTDSSEFVEVVIENPGIYTLSDFSIHLYTGSDGTSYNTKTVDMFTVGNTVGNYTFYTYTYPTDSIENGAPDGLCLSYSGTLISGQFLSYEGTFTATDGPANGITSTDIGVSENSSTPAGYSLQLSGKGLQYNHFTWQDPDNETPGAINNCQLFTALVAVNLNLLISEVADPDDSFNAKFVELYNAGSTLIDLCYDTWYLSREANAPSGSWCDLRLVGTIGSGETMVIGNDDGNPPIAFPDAYGFDADQYSGCVSGNGDDSYYLYYGGNHSSGVLIDAFGVPGVNGAGELWDYIDSKATRKKHVTSPNITWTASEWVIIPAATSEMTPDWSNTLNWNDGVGNPNYSPDAGCDLTIPDRTNDPTISGRASCNNMTINSGAVVTISPTNFLVTGSEIDNNTGVSGLIVKSDASGDGMLLLGTGTTQATIERYLTDDMSHFISAPITDATADNLFQDHSPEVYLYEHHESDDSWQYLVPTSTPMPRGQGFSTWVDNATPDFIVAEFDGSIMSSDLTLNISTTPALSYTSCSPPPDTLGFNLLGNPYPVPLDWTRGSWDSTNVEGTVWIWDPDANTSANPDGSWVWKTMEGGGTSTFNVIPGGQAFFVRTKGLSPSPSLTIPADARSVYYNQAYYKSSRKGDEDSSAYQAEYVVIKALNNQDIDEVWISFNEYGTEDFDNGWDATKMNNSYSTLCIYVPKEYRNQCLEHLPTLLPDEERIVEVNFKTTVDGEHTLAVDMTYLPDTDVTLEDLKYNQMQDMKYDSVYSFAAFASDDPNRFRIHFNKTTTGIEFLEFDPKSDPSVQIYSYEKNIYIKKEDVNSSGYVIVYDLYGREVLTQVLEQTGLMKIPVHLNNTYLIVKVISGSKVATSKVYVR